MCNNFSSPCPSIRASSFIALSMASPSCGVALKSLFRHELSEPVIRHEETFKGRCHLDTLLLVIRSYRAFLSTTLTPQCRYPAWSYLGSANITQDEIDISQSAEWNPSRTRRSHASNSGRWKRSVISHPISRLTWTALDVGGPFVSRSEEYMRWRTCRRGKAANPKKPPPAPIE